MLNKDSWQIGGPLGQALRKLGVFVSNLSAECVYSEPCSDSSGSIWCCGRYFFSVLRSSVQSCARSLFFPLGSWR